MRQRVLNIAAVLAVAMGVMVVMLYARSLSRWDRLSWGRGWVDASGYHAWGWQAVSRSGAVAISYSSSHDPRVRPGDESRWGPDYGYYVGSGVRWGTMEAGALRWPAWSYSRTWRDDSRSLYVRVPHLFLAAVAATPAVAVAFGWRKRRGDGLPCARCGYDRRATPERCPECGAVAGAQAAA